AAAESQILEAKEAHLADLREQLLVLVERHAELRGDLLLGGRTAEAALELVGDLLDQARLLAHAARHPVERAEVVQDRAADAELRVGREERLLGGIVLADRVEEPDDAPGDEVVELDVRGLAGREALHDPAHERQVLPQHLVAVRRQSRVAGGRAAPGARACGPPRFDLRHGPCPLSSCRRRAREPLGRRRLEVVGNATSRGEMGHGQTRATAGGALVALATSVTPAPGPAAAASAATSASTAASPGPAPAVSTST